MHLTRVLFPHIPVPLRTSPLFLETVEQRCFSFLSWCLLTSTFWSRLTRTSVLQSAPPKVEKICNRSEMELIKLCRFVYFRQIRLVSACVTGGPKTACDVICHTEFRQNFPFFPYASFLKHSLKNVTKWTWTPNVVCKLGNTLMSLPKNCSSSKYHFLM